MPKRKFTYEITLREEHRRYLWLKKWLKWLGWTEYWYFRKFTRFLGICARTGWDRSNRSNYLWKYVNLRDYNKKLYLSFLVGRLVSLGLMSVQLRALLKPFNQILFWYLGGFRGEGPQLVPHYGNRDNSRQLSWLISRGH